ncbi:MAG: SoxR reducing system RseC family protein, partial [Pseudomonadota bacterium]|nr:SoxR reducing system RseC family protein [Pseudomonadota bacterium]
PEAGVLSASAWLYLLPLFTFIVAFFTISEALLMVEIRHELAALLPTVAITYCVYRFIASKLTKIESSKYQPVLLKHIKTD